MLIEEARISSKGQVTIPKEFRTRYGLEEGSSVVFKEEEGMIRLEPRAKDPMRALRKLKGEVAFTREEIEEMKREARRAWSHDLSR